MPSIAVLGANGQVGSEVCLSLSLMPGIQVVPVVRSQLAGVLLERCGLVPRVGNVTQDEGLVDGVDLVADLSLPGGLPSQIESGAEAIIRRVVAFAPTGAPYVFFSSTMAFGMPGEAPRYRDKWLARSQYAATKRRAERVAIQAGRANHRPIYVLRLGQVHGELQSVSRSWAAQFQRAVSPLRVAEQSTDTVLCATIALALNAIANKSEPAGKYTLIEEPALTLDEIVRHYVTGLGLPLEVEVGTPESEPSTTQVLTRALRNSLSTGLRSMEERRELITAHLMPRDLHIEWWLKARWLRRRVRQEVAALGGTPFTQIAGPVPGRRLTSLRDCTGESKRLQREVRKLLHRRLGPDSHALPVDPPRSDLSS